MPLTELILTENVPGLGAEADVVKVRRGYARNYLLPRGKAYEVTPAALRQIVVRDPPWNQAMISEAGRMKLGMI